MLDKIRGVIVARIHDEQDRHNEEGFTLIELLIVVIVLGILAAVTVFGLSGASSQSAAASCKADVRTTEAAVDAFHANSTDGSWPGAMTDLTTPVAGTLGQPAGVTPYLRTIPGNPPHYTIGLATAADTTTHVQVGANGGPPGDFDQSLNAGTNLCDAVK